MISLPVYEMFYSVQGEGQYIGMAACFIRLAGCNVCCPFCDEKKAWSAKSGTSMSVAEIVSKVLDFGARSVVISGGEPSLYDLNPLTEELEKNNIRSFLETSGVNEVRGRFFHICVSPKQNKLPLLKKNAEGKECFLNRTDCLKVVIACKEDLRFAEKMYGYVEDLNHTSLYLQPEWSRREEAIAIIIDYIKQNPCWRLSLQTHKYINVK